MNPISLTKTRKLLKKINNVLILMHENPDMDSIGSAYALALYLNNKGVMAVIGTEKPLYERYTFFIDPVDLEKYFLLKNQINREEYEWVVCVDTASPKMLGEFENYIKNKKTIVIDHHKIFTPYGSFYLNISSKSSTSEMIVDLLVKKLNQKMAQALYAGIIYDTGNFKYDSVTPALFRQTASLLEKFSIKTDEMSFYLFENESLERKKLTSLIVSTIESYENGEIIVTSFPESFKKQVQIDDSDSSDLVHVGQSVKGGVFSIFIKDREDGVSISFRTRRSFDVSLLAQKWGGGGHQKAAGLKLKSKSIEDFKKSFLPICIQQYKEWKKSTSALSC